MSGFQVYAVRFYQIQSDYAGPPNEHVHGVLVTSVAEMQLNVRRRKCEMIFHGAMATQTSITRALRATMLLLE